MNKTQAKNAVEEYVDESIAWIHANFDHLVLWYAGMELSEWPWGDWFVFLFGFGASSGGYEPDSPPYPDDDDALKQWMIQEGYDPDTLIAQWKSNNNINTADKYINDLLAEAGCQNLADYVSVLVDYEFVLITYDYQFTTDNALLVQVKLPANKGSNELSGKTFDYGGHAQYAFTASSYTRKSTYNDLTTDTGTYSYDSTTKEVWLRPEKVYNNSSSSLQTMTEYYESGARGNTAAEKAGDTNDEFRVDWERYGLTPVNWLGWYDDDGRYSVRLNRSMADTLEIRNSEPKTLNQTRLNRMPSVKK